MFKQPLPEVRTGVPERPMELDAGIRTFAMLSDGGILQRRPSQSERSAIRRKQRTVSRSRQGSKSRGKTKAALARAHVRMAEAERQELHRLFDRFGQDLRFHCGGGAEEQEHAPQGPGKAGPEPGNGIRLGACRIYSGGRRHGHISALPQPAAGPSFVVSWPVLPW